jgi:hypothetical protein
MPNTFLSVGTTADGVPDRRGFFRTAAAGLGALAAGWRGTLAARAGELKARGKAMILLWMDGGPSQFDTFTPKPGSANQGPARPIATAVPGVQIADFLPKTAGVMDKIALIRSMRTKEAEHDRAIHHLRTGYQISPAVRYPTWGSVVARDRFDPHFELPAFVRVGKPRIATRDVDAGALGVRHASFNIDLPGRLPPDATPAVPADVLRRRMALAGRLDAEFAAAGGSVPVKEKAEVYDRTGRFVLSPRLGVFDLDREPAKLRDAYGRNAFGQGCLLARRLVESGVSFVEVISTGDKRDAGWDTHGNGFEDTPHLCGQADPGYAALLRDLADRGMLDSTLVVWMGEFGRTPKIKADGGRDHYARGWPVALAGGGVRGGQVIGATDKDGVDVSDRPVDVPDLFATFCKVLGIDPDGEYVAPGDRPIKVVEGGAVVKELFS